MYVCVITLYSCKWFTCIHLDWSTYGFEVVDVLVLAGVSAGVSESGHVRESHARSIVHHHPSVLQMPETKKLMIIAKTNILSNITKESESCLPRKRP